MDSLYNKALNFKKARSNSLKLWTAWDGKKLVGQARVVGDGLTIIYIQDILVLKNYQGKVTRTKFIEKI